MLPKAERNPARCRETANDVAIVFAGREAVTPRS